MIGFLFRNSRFVLLLSIFAGFGSGLGGAGLIAVINMALTAEQNAIANLGNLFAALCTLLLLARAASTFLLMRLGQNVVVDLRLRLSRQILSAPFARLQELGPPRILACLTEDVATLSEAFGWLPILCVNGAIVAGCLIYLGWLSGPLLAIFVVFLCIGISGFQFGKRSALNGLKLAREHDDVLYGHLRSLIQGVKELKLHHSRRKVFIRDCLEAASLQYRNHYLSGMGFYILANNWGTGLFYVVIGILLFLIPMWQESPPFWQHVAPEVLRGYCLTILFMMSPLQSMVESLSVFARANVALRKIEALSAEHKETATNTSGTLYQPSRPVMLEMVGVTHRYHEMEGDRSFMLGPVNLTVKAGEMVFLVGGNGSGKTTLSLLLVGLYTPDRGEIRLNGRRIEDENREDYRQLFSAVFSDFYLFDSLLGFDSRELDTEARAYLVRLQLEHKVSIENGVFSTLDLSQGQRKRLALLVAYLENRPFCVFDEWAADQDPVFKKIFYTEILPSLKARGKTVVVITHDDAYFHVADRCLKLEEGKLTELIISSRKGETVAGNFRNEEWRNANVELSS